MSEIKNPFTDELAAEIMKILRRGNSVELKRERGCLTVVEIQRKVNKKTSITG